MDLGLKGKRALITGATRGIGRAIAERLAAEGCDVAICARDAGQVETAVAALAATGVRSWGAAVDVAEPAALTRWVDEAAAALGGVDILVTNASAMAAGAGPEVFRAHFNIDLMHTVNAVTVALPWLERSKSGAIVAIASVSGVEDWGYEEVAYGTMKAALLYYMKGLARHVAPRGIRANVVSPGSIYFRGGVWEKTEREDPKAFAETLQANPFGRMGTPEEIANAVAFVVSPAAGFVAGANFVVDGTLTRRVQN